MLENKEKCYGCESKLRNDKLLRISLLNNIPVLPWKIHFPKDLLFNAAVGSRPLEYNVDGNS